MCFLPGTLALGATKGMTKSKAMRDNLLTFEDLENLRLAEDLVKTCVETYLVTSTGLGPEIAYFHVEVSAFGVLCQKFLSFVTCFRSLVIYICQLSGGDLVTVFSKFIMQDYFEEGYDGGNKSSKYLNDIIIKPADRHNLLRPETVESLFVLYRITEDPKFVNLYCLFIRDVLNL